MRNIENGRRYSAQEKIFQLGPKGKSGATVDWFIRKGVTSENSELL
jgi:hypothetical protein